MNERILLTELPFRNKNYMVFAAVDEKNRLADLALTETGEPGIIGNIYTGRVERISDKTSSAFIRVDEDHCFYLPLPGDGERPIYSHKYAKKAELCQGDEILFQAKKEGIKTKLPTAGLALELKGNLTVLSTDRREIGVSRKIPAQQAAMLKQALAEAFPDRDFGLVVRTNAGERDSDAVLADAGKLRKTLQSIMQLACHSKAGSLLYSQPSALIDRLNDWQFPGLKEVITDKKEIYDAALEHYPVLGEMGKLRFYEDPGLPLSVLYGLTAKLSQLADRRVDLPSGANIIIEQMETLNFIDVNSAKNMKTGKDALFCINLEAAAEILRQIRLRNLSGMILIDFINMPAEKREEFLAGFKKLLAEFPDSGCFVDYTGLGLVEMTRKKKSRSLKECL